MSLGICTPMFGGKCDKEFLDSCLALQRELIAIGMDHSWLFMTNESLITRGRNKLVATFLAETKHEAMLFIDADIEFTPADVAALWNLEKPVAGGCYSRKSPGQEPLVWVDGEERPLADFYAPFKCDRLATGFLMIRRDALMTLIESHDVPDYDESGRTWELFNTPVVEWEGYQGMAEPTGWRRRWMPSEDYYFSELWVRAGGELWTDPSIKLKHWGRAAF